MTFYMHTIKGEPAYFDGEQIVYAWPSGCVESLATSLRQIRAEQKASLKNRMEWYGRDDCEAWADKYGYVRVKEGR